MDKGLRQKLVDFLTSHQAHMTLEDAVADFPVKFINTKAPNVDYTFWHLIEHLRITQNDILDFCINKNYKEPKWPEGYWPKKDKKATKKDWDKTVKDYNSDLNKMVKLVKNPKTDLFAKIPWGEGQTILREAMLIFDHNAYHIGELGILRQVVGAWPKNRK